MAFAPHTNDQIFNGAGEQIAPRVLGCFVEKDEGHLFEFSDRVSDWRGESHLEAYPHLVFVGNGETRMARVLQTVAYVVVDEDEMGQLVVEKWEIKSHRKYIKTSTQHGWF